MFVLVEKAHGGQLASERVFGVSALSKKKCKDF